MDQNWKTSNDEPLRPDHHHLSLRSSRTTCVFKARGKHSGRCGESRIGSRESSFSSCETDIRLTSHRSQRNFRARREEHVADLLRRIEALDSERSALESENQQLLTQLGTVQGQNELLSLVQSSASASSAGISGSGSPAAPAAFAAGSSAATIAPTLLTRRPQARSIGDLRAELMRSWQSVCNALPLEQFDVEVSFLLDELRRIAEAGRLFDEMFSDPRSKSV